MSDVQVIAWVLVIASAIGVAIDASSKGAARGRLGGGLFDMGPLGWFFAVLLLWIIALPAYLVMRSKYIALQRVTPAEGGTIATLDASTAQSAAEKAFCGKCGTPMKAGDAFCVSCGAGR